VHHEDGAVRVLGASVRHRAEQQSGEPAVAAAADDQHLGLRTCVQQFLCRRSASNLVSDVSRPVLAVRVGESLIKRVAGVRFRVPAVREARDPQPGREIHTIIASIPASNTGAGRAAHRNASLDGPDPSTPTTIRFCRSAIRDSITVDQDCMGLPSTVC
jgi:hypothetical protein